MMRYFNIALVVLMLGAATWTYNLKHVAENNLDEIRSLEQQIKLTKDSISLLDADWAYLDQPSRLQTLSNLYQSELQLRPTEPQQIVHPSELPAAPEIPAGDGIADIIAGAMPDTSVKTGSVKGN